jgi:hypothetical protein
MTKQSKVSKKTDINNLVKQSRKQVKIQPLVNKRDRLILEAYSRGAKPAIIAREFQLTRQRIYQIINRNL